MLENKNINDIGNTKLYLNDFNHINIVYFSFIISIVILLHFPSENKTFDQ